MNSIFNLDYERLLKNCAACPRKCGVNRLKNELGFCKAGKVAEVYSAHLHLGEEPPISGQNGSGTIFFAHCNLRCVYCQNYQLSQIENGKPFETEDLAGLMLSLQKEKAHNINLVTPTHYAPQIREAILLAHKGGLNIPIVYNTSGYEGISTLQLLDGIVDVYLADMRYGDNKYALQYSTAPDYVEVNQAAVKEMHRQAGDLKLADNGIAVRGLIIRHLILPHNISGTEEVLKFISRSLGEKTYISFMSQYYPAYNAFKHSGLSRRINKKEYDEALKLLDKYGLHKGWVQEYMGGSVDEGFAGTNIVLDV
ncbi:MAG: 4Fe-4S cluster-binding domain-containing protein [Candidatus Omnitrophica bacterium]|nr:4Fe-4S cluster-binding domain-containing protein [Candidatus Omnitrophota bacterium]